MKYKYIVITHVCDADYGDEVLIKKRYGKHWYDEPLSDFPPIAHCKIMSFKKLAFHPGELLVCDLYGREIAYPQRKPAKWYCRYRTFSSLRNALELAQSITEEYETSNRQHPTPKTDSEWEAWMKLDK